MRSLLIAALLAGFAIPAAAEPLPIDRAFRTPGLNGETPRRLEPIPRRAAISYLKGRPENAKVLDLWERPATGGNGRLLVDGAEIDKARGVSDYRWDMAGRQILISAGGRLYLAGPGGARPRSIGDTLGKASDEGFSPNGAFVTYVREGNLHAIDLKTGKDHALTTEGGGRITFGVAEYIAQQDMYRDNGYWTSPDDRLIALARVDDGGVDQVPLFVETGSAGENMVEHRYPRPGRPNAIVDLFVMPIVGGERIKVDLGADPTAYLARVDWSRDGRTLYVQRQTRDHTRIDLLAVDSATGASRILLTESRKPWVRINDDFTPLANGDFIWGSERTGFHHLYLYHGDGQLVRPITRGDWPLAQSTGDGRHMSPIVGIDEGKGQLFFIASKDTALEQHLYATSYLRTEEPRRITSGNGWWSVNVARGNAGFVGTYNDPKTPPQTAWYGMDGKRLSWIAENRLDAGHPYAPYIDHRSYPEYGTIKAEDGQTLNYSILKPYGFDPSKRYPAIISVYGGPEVTPMVRRTWNAPTDQLLTQAGYVVFRLDNRGTFNRGAAFEMPIYQKMGGPEVVDQLEGKRFLSGLPYIDPARIGVMGWSYGGYMTLRLLTTPGSGFRAGAAGGPPTDWRLYQSHYVEHYMGDPTTSAGAYDASSVLPRLTELAKPDAARLLLIHGMADDNVLVGNSILVMDRLQKAGVPFDLMLYPGEQHHVADPGKQVQLWKTYLEFFGRNLGGGK